MGFGKLKGWENVCLYTSYNSNSQWSLIAFYFTFADTIPNSIIDESSCPGYGFGLTRNRNNFVMLETTINHKNSSEKLSQTIDAMHWLIFSLWEVFRVIWKKYIQWKTFSVCEIFCLITSKQLKSIVCKTVWVWETTLVNGNQILRALIRHVTKFSYTKSVEILRNVF